ncbi:MAG: hypothetical protein QM715_02070 [Nibricoccus sp.]
MNTFPSPSASPANPASPQWGARLFKIGSVLLAVTASYYIFNASVRSQTHLILGIAIMVLSFLPALLWAQRSRPSLPVFEALLFTCLNTYALPLLNGHEDLLRYAETDVTRAALGVIVYQAAAISTYQLVPPIVSVGRFWVEDVISAAFEKWLPWGIGLNTAYIVVSTFTSLIPPNFGSVLRAVFFGFGIICTFMTCRRLGLGQLGPGERAWFFTNLAIQCFVMMATLFLVSTVSLLLLALVGYISAGGRIPIVFTALCLVGLAVLHNGKSAMREKYWTETGRVVPTPTELPAFYSAWFSHGLKPESSEGSQKKLTGKLIDRTSLIHILCLVATYSPEPLPYLHGDTYADIPAQFVPRLVWPNKPLGHVSTSRLSVYYGLQDEEDTLKTTIGFGMVSEAFANFGFAGLAGLGLLVGFAFKKTMSAAARGPLFSYGGLLTIILLAWSFQVEFTLSIWLSSLYQASIVVLGIPFLLRMFFAPSS